MCGPKWTILFRAGGIVASSAGADIEDWSVLVAIV